MYPGCVPFLTYHIPCDSRYYLLLLSFQSWGVSYSCNPWLDSVPLDCWPETVFNFLHVDPFHWVAHNKAVGFIQVGGWKWGTERLEEREVTIFYNLTLEVTSHYFYYSLLNKSKSPDLGHSQGEGVLHKVILTRKWDHWELFYKLIQYWACRWLSMNISYIAE